MMRLPGSRTGARPLLMAGLLAAGLNLPSGSGWCAPGDGSTTIAADGGVETAADRIKGRSFPSVFLSWNTAEAINYGAGGRPKVGIATVEDPIATFARHDLMWCEFSRIGLRHQGPPGSLLTDPQFTPASIDNARGMRAKLLAANPHMVILASLHYFAATSEYLPPESPWWKAGPQEGRPQGGRQQVGGPEYHASRLDFANPEFQNATAALCAAAIRTGVFDGCFLDFWHDQNNTAARVSLIQKIRSAIPPKAILVGNVNGFLPQHTAEYLNGMFMEGFGNQMARYFGDWRVAASNLGWGESHLRQPAFTALEGNWASSRDDYPLMRKVTTMSLVFSNGYVLFGDPNQLPTPDHLHDWYPFWDKTLGRPVGPLAQPDHPDANGAFSRAYENGAVVFNPPENHPVTVRFPTPRQSAGTGQVGTSFTVGPGDGDLFLNAVH